MKKRRWLSVLIAAALLTVLALPINAIGRIMQGRVVTKRPVEPVKPSIKQPVGKAAPPIPIASTTMAGHLMRRIGFGPTQAELTHIVSVGLDKYIQEQLNPSAIDDTVADQKVAQVAVNFDDVTTYTRRWYIRMTYSQRQFLEKMTFFWHAHFAASFNKVGDAVYMNTQEQLFRRDAFGSFRQFLIDVTIDPAMMVWLDNNNNRGDRNNIPNENYAREFMQLFALGAMQQKQDGTPLLDNLGNPVPSYSETDVREVARALSGWKVVVVDQNTRVPSAVFDSTRHDTGVKHILGQTVNGRTGADGANEVGDIVNILMAQPTMAPFIAKELIFEFATEKPSPAYVQRIATVFTQSGGNIKTVMLALLEDPEFWSKTVIRSQVKTPIEQFIAPVRALGGSTKGQTIDTSTYSTSSAKQRVYFPPSVFSFYPPGQKEALLAADLVIIRDNYADVLANAPTSADTFIDLTALKASINASTPDAMVDGLSNALMQAPLEQQTRARIILWFGGTLTDSKIKTAIWLLLTCPDYQRN
jgi:uncharacterized protein (DUF1800 family)